LAELNSYKSGANKASAGEDKDDDEDESGGDGEDKLSKGEVMDLFKMLMKAKVRKNTKAFYFRQGFYTFLRIFQSALLRGSTFLLFPLLTFPSLALSFSCEGCERPNAGSNQRRRRQQQWLSSSRSC